MTLFLVITPELQVANSKQDLQIMVSRTINLVFILTFSFSIIGCNKKTTNIEVDNNTELDNNISTPPVIPDESETEEPPSPVVQPTLLSLVNPIDDMTLVADTVLDFVIPDNTCAAGADDNIVYEIVSVENNVGFVVLESKFLTGLANNIGEVAVIIRCSANNYSLNFKFTISVIDILVDPEVEIKAPSIAKVEDSITLEAFAKNNNLFGSIVSYSWTETSNLGIDLINADSDSLSFTTPDTTQQSTASFSVTVTDNAGYTATDSVSIELISSNAPKVDLSFPLSFGVYSEQSINMFGNFQSQNGDTIEDVTLMVDDIKYTASTHNGVWRVEDVDLSSSTQIVILITSANGFINYENIKLNNDTLFYSAINNRLSDIVLDDAKDELYVQVNGEYSSQTEFLKYNLATTKNSTLSISQPRDYPFSSSIPTSIELDSASNSLFVSYESGIAKIDLNTGDETIVSDINNGTGTVPALAMDLAFSQTNRRLFYTDLSNRTINSVDITTGDRVEVHNSITNLLSYNINESNGDFYYSQGVNLGGQTLIRKFDNSLVAFDNLYDQISGGPISDLAIDELNGHLYFVDDSGSLMKINLSDNSITSIINNLFMIEDVVDSTTPLIGLDFHSVRNVLIASGKGLNGKNILLMIDPVTGQYAKIAEGD